MFLAELPDDIAKEHLIKLSILRNHIEDAVNESKFITESVNNSMIIITSSPVDSVNDWALMRLLINNELNLQIVGDDFSEIFI